MIIVPATVLHVSDGRLASDKEAQAIKWGASEIDHWVAGAGAEGLHYLTLPNILGREILRADEFGLDSFRVFEHITPSTVWNRIGDAYWVRCGRWRVGVRPEDVELEISQ